MLVVKTTPNNQSEQFYYQPQHMRKEHLNVIGIPLILLYLIAV